MIPSKLPKGTTLEQWERYEKELQTHETNIDRRRYELGRLVAHLKFIAPERIAWTPDQIMSVMKKEIDRSWSMDRPNEPGSYRANND